MALSNGIFINTDKCSLARLHVTLHFIFLNFSFLFVSDAIPNPTNGECAEGFVKTYNMFTHQPACGMYS